MRAWSQESEEIIQSLKVQSCQHLHCNPKFFFFFLHFETQAVRFVNFTSSSSFFFFKHIEVYWLQHKGAEGQDSRGEAVCLQVQMLLDKTIFPINLLKTTTKKTSTLSWHAIHCARSNPVKTRSSSWDNWQIGGLWMRGIWVPQNCTTNYVCMYFCVLGNLRGQ